MTEDFQLDVPQGLQFGRESYEGVDPETPTPGEEAGMDVNPLESGTGVGVGGPGPDGQHCCCTFFAEPVSMLGSPESVRYLKVINKCCFLIKMAAVGSDTYN